MAPVLTPAQASAYVRELSADVRAVAVLDAGGEALAGEPRFAAAARDLVRLPDTPLSRPGGGELVARVPGGVLFAARSRTRTLVAAAGPLSLTGPTALDIRAGLLALDGADPGAAPTAAPPPTVVDPALGRAVANLLAAV